MAEIKILDAEFRKELYKSLTEAGYDKNEAQEIVGVKYYDALKEDTKGILNSLWEAINKENYDFDMEKSAPLAANFSELKKMSEFLKSRQKE